MEASASTALLPNSFSTELLPEKPELLITCYICKQIPNPYRSLIHPSCSKVFCKNCILGTLSQESSCPHCHQPINNLETDLSIVKDQRKDILATICSYNVHCPKFNPTDLQSCLWIGQIAFLSSHLTTCKYTLQICKWGCGAEFTIEELVYHENDQCSLRKIKCEYCGKLIAINLLESHKVTECDKIFGKTTPCKFSEMGCTFVGNLSELTAHYENAMKDHLSYSIKHASMLKSKVSLNEKIISKLKSANKVGLRKYNPPVTIIKENNYFKKCKAKHPLQMDRTFIKVECTACAVTIDSGSDLWVCTTCQFYICLKCAAVKYQADREPFLYSYCPACIDGPKALVKRGKPSNASSFNCGCVNTKAGGYYYCVYCGFTVCSNCQIPITYD